ncbi:hypothetical protein F4820DRAFT_340379 [Hypoxylon rubiginosum]|uniref:Uncharacterized protein n=1 Tax=Hypoxylon rubiginosum TaxID=110542 RepID=A0ACB9YY10_9PEZI|nr:hypothetical protein F4820DRAFT_340379 [Hypoxylon rubiginosum]
MCGDHTRQSCGGALAVLSLPMRSTRSMPPTMAGRLIFHDCGKGSSTATHLTFTPDESTTTHSPTDADSWVVAIHETGDLTKSAIISPFLHRFSMTQSHPTSQDDRQVRSIEVPLTYPVKIEVGSDGIIGRRVTLWSQHATDPIAEGVIGYN